MNEGQHLDYCLTNLTMSRKYEFFGLVYLESMVFSSNQLLIGWWSVYHLKQLNLIHQIGIQTQWNAGPAFDCHVSFFRPIRRDNTMNVITLFSLAQFFYLVLISYVRWRPNRACFSIEFIYRFLKYVVHLIQLILFGINECNYVSGRIVT